MRATASRLGLDYALRERKGYKDGLHATAWMVLRGYFAAARSLQVLESLYKSHAAVIVFVCSRRKSRCCSC